MAPGLIRRHAGTRRSFFCVTRRAARELKQDRLSQHFKGGPVKPVSFAFSVGKERIE